jgi:CheY-like chemotaxis protein
MKTILVADDDCVNLELTCAILEGGGFAVVPANDGREVLDTIESVRPDLLLLDIQMPRVDGFGVVTRLRKDQRYANLPIIATSASAMSGDKALALSRGFDAYVEKPFEIAGLLEVLNRYLAAE